MELVVEKSKRKMTLLDGDVPVFSCTVALGRNPVDKKRAEGDGCTPEGRFYICLVKEQGKYGRSLGLSYPAREDAELAFAEGRIDQGALRAVHAAWDEHRRPPWGTALGGEIYIHEGGTASDWTQGCIALESGDMDRLFPLRDEIAAVIIRP